MCARLICESVVHACMVKEFTDFFMNNVGDDISPMEFRVGIAFSFTIGNVIFTH